MKVDSEEGGTCSKTVKDGSKSKMQHLLNIHWSRWSSGNMGDSMVCFSLPSIDEVTYFGIDQCKKGAHTKLYSNMRLPYFILCGTSYEGCNSVFLKLSDLLGKSTQVH